VSRVAGLTRDLSAGVNGSERFRHGTVSAEAAPRPTMRFAAHPGPSEPRPGS